MQSTVGFRLLAYVIMPEHVHLVLVPADGTKLGMIIREIKRLSSRQIHQLLAECGSKLIDRFSVKRNGKARFALWQRRCYDHNCRTEKSVWEKVFYCHNNRVKRGLVQDPGRWRWSSFGWYEDSTEDRLDREFDRPTM